ncbi:MAG: hypothetical protein ACRDNE_00945 [Gaiellaceae bacterium]
MEIPLVLALLACPVGMGLMMWFMSRGMKQGGAGSGRSSAGPISVEELREEQGRLEAEIVRREGQQPKSVEQLREEQSRLAAEIARREGAGSVG